MFNYNILQKALSKVKKTQSNFVNGDGRDDQDSIHTQPVGNENGSISRTQSADGRGNDPVDSSDDTKTNPTDLARHEVRNQGTRYSHVGNGTKDKDPVSISGDGRPDDPENKSVGRKHPEAYDHSSKDKNGVRSVHSPVKNGTRKISDKPSDNPQHVDHELNTMSSSKHDDNALASASINKLVNLFKGLAHGVNVNAGAINELQKQYQNAIPINKVKSLVQDSISNINKENKHMNPANIRGMFYHAEHSRGKHHTKEMADAENAVTRCHHSHKSLTPEQWGNIEVAAFTQAAKSINDMAKSLDSKLVHDAKSGNTKALAKDNYKYDHEKNHSKKALTSEKGGKTSMADCMSKLASAKENGNDSLIATVDSMLNGTHKSIQSASADKSMNLSSCKAIMQSASKAGNKSLYASCASMCNSMATNANTKKGVSENYGSHANSASAISSSKPVDSSDDINHSQKSMASNVTKSMPHAKATDATPRVKKSVKGKNTVKKSVNSTSTVLPYPMLKNYANLYKSIYHNRGKHMIGAQGTIRKAVSLCDQAINNNDYNALRKSIHVFKHPVIK